MELNRLVEEILARRRGKLTDIGVTVVRRCSSEADEAPVDYAKLGEALGELVDLALESVSSREERRLEVRSRPAARGHVVEIEYASAESSESEAPAAVEEATRAHAVKELDRCRRLLGSLGGRIFVNSPESRTTRFVVELPPK